MTTSKMNLKVNWMIGYLNDPIMSITGIEISPEDFVFVKKEVTGGFLYYGRNIKHPYIVEFFLHSIKDETGSYGSVKTVKMADGTVESIKGKWSSNSGSINDNVNGERYHVLEAVIGNTSAYAVTIDKLRELLPKGVELVKGKYSIYRARPTTDYPGWEELVDQKPELGELIGITNCGECRRRGLQCDLDEENGGCSQLS